MEHVLELARGQEATCAAARAIRVLSQAEHHNRAGLTRQLRTEAVDEALILIGALIEVVDEDDDRDALPNALYEVRRRNARLQVPDEGMKEVDLVLALLVVNRELSRFPRGGILCPKLLPELPFLLDAITKYRSQRLCGVRVD